MKITGAERSCKSQSRVVINRERKTPRGPVSGKGVRKVVSWCGKNHQARPRAGCWSRGAAKTSVVGWTHRAEAAKRNRATELHSENCLNEEHLR